MGSRPDTYNNNTAQRVNAAGGYLTDRRRKTGTEGADWRNVTGRLSEADQGVFELATQRNNDIISFLSRVEEADPELAEEAAKLKHDIWIMQK